MDSIRQFSPSSFAVLIIYKLRVNPSGLRLWIATSTHTSFSSVFECALQDYTPEQLEAIKVGEAIMELKAHKLVKPIIAAEHTVCTMLSRKGQKYCTVFASLVHVHLKWHA